MSTELSPERSGSPPRRGPAVDVDPTGILAGKSPDRQRRQFLIRSTGSTRYSGDSPSTSNDWQRPGSANW
jgi:hypothetical protein